MKRVLQRWLGRRPERGSSGLPGYGSRCSPPSSSAHTALTPRRSSSTTASSSTVNQRPLSSTLLSHVNSLACDTKSQCTQSRGQVSGPMLYALSALPSPLCAMRYALSTATAHGSLSWNSAPGEPIGSGRSFRAAAHNADPPSPLEASRWHPPSIPATGRFHERTNRPGVACP